jgi:TonB family protein
MRIWALLLLLAAAVNMPAQSVPGTQIYAYPSEPFTGQETIVWTHQVGGKMAVGHLVGKIVRDNQGRIYRENHSFTAGTPDPQTALNYTTVYDPIAGTKTECELSRRLCRITNFQAPRLALEVQRALSTKAETAHEIGVPYSVLVDNGKHLLTLENLGARTIGDISAHGTRRTTSMAPDATGDDKSGTSVIESWYSKDLLATVSETRNYPNGEIQALELRVQALAEPDPKTFATPNGFVVQDNRSLLTPAGPAGSNNSPVERIGGPVSAPVVIHQVQPQYTAEARAAKIKGNVLVNLVVDTQGVPQNVRVIRGFDKELDQKAVDAVAQYRFKPAMRDSKPVAVELNIEVVFQIF